MPLEYLTVNVHSVIESTGPDWLVDALSYTDNDPNYDVGENGPRTYLPNLFWAAAKVTNPGDDDVRLYYRSSIGSNSLAAIIGAHTAGVDLSDAVGNDSVMYDWIPQGYLNNSDSDPRLFWSVAEGAEFPSFVRIVSDWSYEVEHHYGIDYLPDVGPYTWAGNDVPEPVVSDWDAPLEPVSVNDNVGYVGAVARRGTNWDIGEPEVGVSMVTISVYQRVFETGLISGEYLGADRRFTGV